MLCTVCGQWGDLRHFLIDGDDVLCRPSLEASGVIEDVEPMWFCGPLNEAGEVYGG
jgi:hypothetical protein